MARRREGMSPAHLAWLRTLPCPITGRYPCEAHHLLRDPSAPRGMGMKTPDRCAIPLAPEMHRALHDHGDEVWFLAVRGIDGPALAAALWKESGNTAAGLRIIARCRFYPASKSDIRNG